MKAYPNPAWDIASDNKCETKSTGWKPEPTKPAPEIVHLLQAYSLLSCLINIFTWDFAPRWDIIGFQPIL